MLKRIFLLSVLTGAPCTLIAQEDVFSSNDTIQLSTVKATAELPITGEIVRHESIEENNLGQDMPILLKNSTSIVTTSDAGNGVGYTGLRIRGIDQSQINVTFNGVPINDSESHGVYWVDFPDVSSSSSEILIQRGVGTSSNGAAAFGASINLETNGRKSNRFAEIMTAVGSFNTQKSMIALGSGDLYDKKFNIDLRLSKIQSDGFLDRATSNLYSGALNAYYRPNSNTEFQIMNLFGHEKTYQAWNGVSDSQIKDYGRTFNPAGAIWGKNGVEGYYDNQVDNYDQNHLHAYWRQKLNNGWKSTTTLHWTRGIGYYEEYKQGRKLKEYGFNSDDKADLVRRKWLDNNFYGAIFNLERKYFNDFDLYFGASLNKYIGGHYGTVIDVIGSDLSRDGYYYHNESIKNEFSTFGKALYHIGNIEFFGDLQYRKIGYKADYKGDNGASDAEDFAPYKFNWSFINPKAGINLRLPYGKLYASYGLTHREPTRSDIEDNPGLVKPETLNDYELGFRANGRISFGINVFYMKYQDQLVLTGKLNDVGTPIRQNVGRSYRKGIELDVNSEIIKSKLNLFANLTLSKNKNKNFIEDDGKGNLVSYGDTPIAYSPEVISSFGLDVFPISNLKLTLTNKYVGSQYVNNFNNDEAKLKSYFLSDISANYKLNIKNTPVELSLLINNLFDKEYTANGYWYDELYTYPQAGINILGGVKVKF